MPGEFCKNHDVVWYMMESQSRVVAKSGIPSDRFHLGKLILQGLRDAPDYVMQIDAVSGEEITFGEILERSVRCASAFQNIGLKQGDVVLLIASNNLNISVPYYAGLYTGLVISGLDWTFGVRELQNAFENLKPKLIFCLNDKVQDIQLALEKSSPSCKIVSFDESQTVLSFDNFLGKHGDLNSIEDFRATELDPEKTIGVIIPTSGTTGTPKGAAVSHKALFFHGIVLWTYGKQFPEPTRLALVTSPLQWLSAHLMFVGSPLLRFTRLMYTQPSTPELLTEMINKYRPTFSVLSPPMLALITGEEKCDATCFEQLLVGGSAVHKDLIIKFKSKSPKTQVLSAFGATEFGGAYCTELTDSLGQPMGFVRARLVDPETQEDVNEPHRRGELWTKGHSMFLGYYNNPTETKNAFSEDGWFKTGDLFYKDKYGNIHFVERMKLLLKYKNYQISPVEIESVILQNPGVNDVCVVGIPDLELGELAVAFVVKKDGATVTAQDIKNVVKQNLAETKHLHGGVIFIDKLPLTVSTKVHRQKLKEMAKTMVRE